MNKDVKVVCEVKDTVLDLLRQANQAKDFSMGDVDFLYKATKAVKNACEIKEMMQEDGYSEGADGYGHGSSYANRGQHWVHGHYSHDGGMGGNDGGRRDSRGRYSRSGGMEEMLEHVRMAVESAPEEYREDIQRFMRSLENR